MYVLTIVLYCTVLYCTCRTETLGGIVKKWYGELNEDIQEYQKQVTHTHSQRHTHTHTYTHIHTHTNTFTHIHTHTHTHMPHNIDIKHHQIFG